jgi:hypothetical protein
VYPLPVSQTLVQLPQALLSIFRLTQDPLQDVSPAMHCDTHAPLTQAHWEFAGSEPLHAAQLPPQQMPVPPEHDVPSPSDPVDMHTGWPVVHDVVPVWHVLPPGLHAALVVQATQLPW